MSPGFAGSGCRTTPATAWRASPESWVGPLKDPARFPRQLPELRELRGITVTVHSTIVLPRQSPRFSTLQIEWTVTVIPTLSPPYGRRVAAPAMNSQGRVGRTDPAARRHRQGAEVCFRNTLSDVRFRGNSGKHLLVLSFSQFDPFETSADRSRRPVGTRFISQPDASWALWRQARTGKW